MSNSQILFFFDITSPQVVQLYRKFSLGTACMFLTQVNARKHVADSGAFSPPFSRSPHERTQGGWHFPKVLEIHVKALSGPKDMAETLTTCPQN